MKKLESLFHCWRVVIPQSTIGLWTDYNRSNIHHL